MAASASVDRAEGRGADEGRRAAQSAQRVLLVAGVLGHSRHGERVQGLEQQRAHAADQHGGQVGVDPAGDAVRRQERVVGIGGDRGPFAPDADGAPHVARHVAPGRRGQAADEAERGGGDRAAERGGALHRVQRRHGDSLARGRGRVQRMRFVVVGAGAIGGAVGGRLFERGYDVTLVARGDHGRALESGLVLEAPDGTVTLPVPVVEDPAQVPWDGDADGDPVVLLAVKGQHTDHALTQLTAVAPPTAPVVCMQNGVENERRVLRHFPHTYGMCVMCPATQLRPGVVQMHSAPVSGLLDLGCFPVRPGRARSGHRRRHRHDDLPVGGPARHHALEVPQAPHEPGQRGRGPGGARGPVRSAGARGAARGQGGAGGGRHRRGAASEEDRERRGDLLQMAPTPSGEWRGGSSWQSLARGAGSIEAEFLNGEIVLLGGLHGVPTPVNALLQRLAHAGRGRGRRCRVLAHRGAERAGGRVPW